jgi:pimeloyl-ACP methyl ester carboxylesterase
MNSAWQPEDVARVSPESQGHPSVNFIRRGKGPPVILIHGLAASLHDWDFLLPKLAESGYTGYALDLLGHGESFKPNRLDDYSGKQVLSHLASWIESLHLKDPAVLISHSMGGWVALEYALQFPACVRALVLVNPLFRLRQLPPSLQLFYHHRLVNTAVIAHTPYWLFRILVDLSSLNLKPGVGRLHNLSREVRLQTSKDYKRAAPGVFHILSTLSDLTPDLGRIQVPALVIWGIHDLTLNPNSFNQLVALLPKGWGEAMRTCGHVPHQCHADRFNQLVLEFLAGL